MIQKSKRILIFTTAYRPLIGGSEIAIENIVRRLPNIFFDIVTLLSRPDLKKLECSENYCIHRLIPDNKLGKLVFPVFGFFKGLSLIGKNSYRAVHAYQASSAAGAAWLIKIFKPSLPFILTLQEGKDLAKQSWFVKFFRKLIIKKAGSITAISNYLKEFARSINEKAPIEVIPNGVDVQRISNTKMDESIFKRLNLKKEDRIIISVSRLVPKNGLETLIDAMVKIKERINHIKLLIIGFGPLFNDLKKRVSLLNLDDSVLFLEEIEHSQLPPYLKMADVFARPSLSEGLGNAFLEAMAANVPVVWYKPVGGICDFGDSGLAGYNFDSRDAVNGVAQAILEILTNERLKEEQRAKGQRVAEKYDWSGIAQRMNQVYEKFQ